MFSSPKLQIGETTGKRKLPCFASLKSRLAGELKLPKKVTITWAAMHHVCLTRKFVLAEAPLTCHTGGYASGGFSDRGSDPGQGQGFPEDSMAELDQWADLAAAGDRAFPGGARPADADADSMSYEELCQAHIEAFIQVCLCVCVCLFVCSCVCVSVCECF